MGTSGTDSGTDIDQPSAENLLEKLRGAGPAGYVFVGALLLAVVVVVANLVGSDDDSPTVEATDVSTTTTTPDVTATVASNEPPDTEPTVAGSPDRAALRAATEAFEQCLRDRGLPVRVRSASETEVEIGLRGDGDLDAILADPAVEECSALHLGEFDMAITAGDGSGEGRSVDTTIPESTDGSTPPTQPTTDTTTP